MTPDVRRELITIRFTRRQVSQLEGIWEHKALQDLVEREDDLAGTDIFEDDDSEDGDEGVFEEEEGDDDDDDGEKVEDADGSDDLLEDEEAYDGGEFQAEIDEEMEASDTDMDELLELVF